MTKTNHRLPLFDVGDKVAITDHWYLPAGLTGRVYRLEDAAHPDCGPATVAVKWNLASKEHPYQWLNVEPRQIRKIEELTQ